MIRTATLPTTKKKQLALHKRDNTGSDVLQYSAALLEHHLKLVNDGGHDYYNNTSDENYGSNWSLVAQGVHFGYQVQMRGRVDIALWQKFAADVLKRLKSTTMTKK